jgi:hypothetical protein
MPKERIFNYQKGRKEYKTDKVAISEIKTAFFRVMHHIVSSKRYIDKHHLFVAILGLTFGASETRAHYFLPTFASSTAKFINA